MALVKISDKGIIIDTNITQGIPLSEDWIEVPLEIASEPYKWVYDYEQNIFIRNIEEVVEEIIISNDERDLIIAELMLQNADLQQQINDMSMILVDILIGGDSDG